MWSTAFYSEYYLGCQSRRTHLSLIFIQQYRGQKLGTLGPVPVTYIDGSRAVVVWVLAEVLS